MEARSRAASLRPSKVVSPGPGRARRVPVPSSSKRTTTMSNEICAADQAAIADMQRLLKLQKQAVLDQGAPSLQLRYDRLDRLSAALHRNRNKLAEAMSQDFG